MSDLNYLKKQLKNAEDLYKTYDPNSIMGCHYSSKIALLKREIAKKTGAVK